MANDDFVKALASTNELEIAVKGRKTGASVSIPVWFILETRKLWLLPLEGSDTNWYKNLVKEPIVQISAGGQRLIIKANPVTDLQKVNEVTDKFRSKYGSGEVKKYYSKFDACVELRL